MSMMTGARKQLHRLLDRHGFALTRKERSNLDWFYPVPTNCEISHVPFFFEFFFGQRTTGLFIEVGAFDGYNYSNTYGLARRNWTGYLIEPDPAHYEQCRERYRDYPNITVSNCAISNGATDKLSLTRGGLITTSSSAQAEAYRQTKYFRDMITEETFLADCYTFDTYLRNHNVPMDPDVVVVDVEGATADVFSGFSLPTWRPKMLIVELFDFHPSLGATRASDHEVRRHILQSGYEAIHQDSINSIFVRTDLIDEKMR